MARPTVLVVDGQDSRRKELTRGLAGFAYEVVGAENAAAGMRFATGLNPAVIVSTPDMEGFGDLSVLKFLAPPGDDHATTLVLMVENEGEAAEEETPENVLALPIAGLTAVAILRKLRTLLVSLELGLATDARLESIVGDLQMSPLFELLPLLQKAIVTGRLLTEEGEVALADGQVIGARAGNSRCLKAFCRLGRTASGTFRLLLGPPGVEREIDQDLLTLMAKAMEDQHRFDEASARLPDLESRVRVELGPTFFSTQFTPAQQEVLKASQAGMTIRAVSETVAIPDGQALDEIDRVAALGFLKFEEPEVKVRIMVDSTADLPPEAARRNRIHVVPLSVIFGNEVYRDGVDLTPGGFYKLLAARKDAHPKTSPPSKGEILVNLRGLVPRADVVAIHLSEKLSQTVVNCRSAVEEGVGELRSLRAEGGGLVGPEIEVVDTRSVSAGSGVLAILASRMAHRGLSAAEIRRRLEDMRERLHLLFVVDTLEYLARGGRIGKARATIGSLLGIKPILGVVDGEVAAVDKVRGGKAAHPRLVDLFKQRVDPARPVVVGIAHAAAPVWADRLRTLLQESFQVLELFQSEIGPVVGTHVGPGSVGAVMLQPTEDELPLVAPLPVSD